VLGFERALTEQLADRFEILMVSQDVLAEVMAFNNSSVTDLLGPEAALQLAALVKDRQQNVDGALKALSLQYPGYAESVTQRELERAAIRFESLEYSRRLQESIISREVYADLRGELSKRRSAVIQRPSLDLGLELAKMIGRVSLFASLDQRALRELGRRLRARVGDTGREDHQGRRSVQRHVLHRRRRGDRAHRRRTGRAEGGRVRGRDGFARLAAAQRRRRRQRLLPSAGAAPQGLQRAAGPPPRGPQGIETVAARRIADTPSG